MIYFATDLHGKIERYEKLFNQIEIGKPEAVFLGGDLFPRVPPVFQNTVIKDFLPDFFVPALGRLKKKLGADYPSIYLILGNDDPRKEEEILLALEEKTALFYYAHNRLLPFKTYSIFGYSYVPPTPFLLKDWEKFDVSHYLDPVAISPLEGWRTVVVDELDIDYYTIQKDLQKWETQFDFANTIFLFHSPPYKTNLDRAALDGRKIDHVPLDVHVGSIAIKRFIEKNQPYLTMHGHIHESTRLTGSWQEKIGNTYSFNAAIEFPDLAIIAFPVEQPELAQRMVL